MISKKSLFSWIFERFRGLQLLLLLLILVTIVARVFPLEMQKRIVNHAIRLRDLDALYLYCGLYISAVVLAGTLKYVINVLQGYIGQRILYEMRSQLYMHILRLPIAFFRKTPPGMVIASLTSELNAVGEFMGGAIATPVINVLTLVSFAGYMFYLNPLLALLSFSIYPIEVIIIPMLQNRFNRLNQQRINVTRDLSSVIGEAVSGIHEIHGNASYQVEDRKLDRFTSSLFQLRHRMNVFRYLIKFFNNFFQSLGPFILFLVGGYLSIMGRLDLGALVAFLSAYEKLYDPWKELMDYYQDFQDTRVRYYQVMNAFDLRPEFPLRPEEDRQPYDLKGRIDVKDLDYVVNGQIRILDQVSFSLKPGEQMALVGFSGSGKSTLAMILGQLSGYNRGHVLLDERELSSLTKLDVSRNIGYVAQNPFIFNGTILENVLYAVRSLNSGNPADSRDPAREDVLSVVEAVGFAEDLLRISLNSTLRRDRHADFAERIVTLRDVFYHRWGMEFASVVDFFDPEHYLYYTNVAENITFGYPNSKDYELAQLSRNALFLEFLKENGLLAPLIELGIELAKQTVVLLEDLRDEAFFFEMSPIPREEFELYQTLVGQLSKSGGQRAGKRERQAFLELSLRFIPLRHKMASLPGSLEKQILRARHRFVAKMMRHDPEAFTFYHKTQYLYTHSILENILFGHPRMDRPHGMERIQECVIGLLKEENLLDGVMEVGLEFEVGSKGDRLSGGQRQKIALARALLKNPRVLILDEATASLDNRSQARIQQLFASELKGKCTLVSVVHRLELVRDYDLIAVMKAGKIVESGRYEELMARKGLFYELARGA